MIDKNIIRLRCEVFKNKYNRKTKKVYTHLENPIKTGIVSPHHPSPHLIEIPSDGVCPLIKDGTLKGNYLLFSTLRFVSKLEL